MWCHRRGAAGCLGVRRGRGPRCVVNPNLEVEGYSYVNLVPAQEHRSADAWKPGRHAGVSTDSPTDRRTAGGGDVVRRPSAPAAPPAPPPCPGLVGAPPRPWCRAEHEVDVVDGPHLTWSTRHEGSGTAPTTSAASASASGRGRRPSITGSPWGASVGAEQHPSSHPGRATPSHVDDRDGLPLGHLDAHRVRPGARHLDGAHRRQVLHAGLDRGQVRGGERHSCGTRPRTPPRAR